MMQPERARAAPTATAVITRGSRTRKTMASVWVVPLPRTVSRTWLTVIPEEPLAAANSIRVASTESRIKSARRFLRRKRS